MGRRCWPVLRNGQELGCSTARAGAIVMPAPATIFATGRCLARLANPFSDKGVALPSCFIAAVGAAGF